MWLCDLTSNNHYKLCQTRLVVIKKVNPGKIGLLSLKNSCYLQDIGDFNKISAINSLGDPELILGWMENYLFCFGLRFSLFQCDFLQGLIRISIGRTFDGFDG